MRILQVADHFPPDSGGLATHVARLSQALRMRDHQLAVVSVGAERSLGSAAEAIPVYRLPHILTRTSRAYLEGSPLFHPPWPDRTFKVGLQRIVADFQPDAIHAHGWCAFSVAATDRTGSVPLVTTLHDYGLCCPKKSLERYGSVCTTGRGRFCLSCDSWTQSFAKRSALAAALELAVPWLVRRTSRLICVSDYVRARHEQLGIPASKLLTIPNFVDTSANVPQTEDGVEGRYALYVGPSGRHKGRAVLLDAYQRLGEQAIELVLVGTVDRAEDLPVGVTSRGYLSGRELVEAYQGASFAIVPSVWADPCPTVALEAMASGKPVIASDVGGLTEMVGADECGLLVPAGDADALAEAISRLVADDEMRTAMGERARRRAMRYSSEEVLPRLEECYAGRPAAGGDDSVCRMPPI